MATPRKHWFRVADSIANEPIGNDELATWIRLLAELNTRWARDGRSADEAGTITLPASHLASITGKQRFDASLEVLSRLSSVVELEIEVEGVVPVVYFLRRADGLVKIGTTGNFPQRRAVLERDHGELEILGVLPNAGRATEKAIHRELKADRVEGEWFYPSPAVITRAADGTSTGGTWEARGQYKSSPRATITVRNYAEFQGLKKPRRPENAPSARRPRKTQDARRKTQEREGRDSAHTPEGYEYPNGIVPMLKLNAKSTKAERSVWAEAVWPEVLAAARIESDGGSSFRDHFVKILSARWNAYLRERDPTRRAYAREARVRSLDAAKAKLDATLDAETPEADDDDPLRFMRAGGNPYASN